MENTMFKTRVELGMTLEIYVDACHEDNAGAIAEDIAHDIATQMAHWYETQQDNDVYIPAWGVCCTDVEPVDYEKGE